jgi:hypothetical protein
MHSIALISNTGKLASISNFDEDVKHLCEEIYKFLDYMQGPMFTEYLSSLTQTVKSVLNLVGNAAMFLEDCFNNEPNSQLCTF